VRGGTVDGGNQIQIKIKIKIKIRPNNKLKSAAANSSVMES